MVLAEAVGEAAGKLKQGQNMSVALIESDRFPKLAMQMIKMGEETGRLEEMLLRVANIYDKPVTGIYHSNACLDGTSAYYLFRVNNCRDHCFNFDGYFECK